MSPLSNAFLREEDLVRMEPFYPLRLLVCEQCYLVQTEEYESPAAIFDSDYGYFSSFSDTWLTHASDYADRMVQRIPLRPDSLVLEIASNDGYLLQYFARQGIPVLGIEPAENVAAVARSKGITTETCFFGARTAEQLVREGRRADLVVGNNVLAHVPDVNDFVEGLKLALKPNGTITMEFPHLLRLLDDTLFDTVYHEHFSYLSLSTAEAIFAREGLVVFDVEELGTHGGSLRIYARHAGHAAAPVSESVHRLRRLEQDRGLGTIEAYDSFGARVVATKWGALEFLMQAAREGRRVVGYGAPAKSTTFLNYCGIRSDLIAFTVDRSPHKQGRFIPGVHLPIRAPEAIDAARPDYVVIFPWNLRTEIAHQMRHISNWGGRFVQFIPELQVLP
jgi:2-polyprenyl-3-methyl-5-hydroxy-6-metoxy-1,4-benzoquinol methylase